MKHECNKWINGKQWGHCCVCNGREHMPGCTSKKNPKIDCCNERHRALYLQGQTVGIGDSSQPMWDGECVKEYGDAPNVQA